MPLDSKKSNPTQLSQDDILAILADRPSILMAQATQLVEERETILARRCPNCATPLVGATNPDPKLAFTTAGVKLIAMCPVCKYRDTGPSK